MKGILRNMEICTECTGCMCCYNSCPKNAITIIQDKKGFYIPDIDKKKCINCDLCKKICPQNCNIEKNEPKEVIASWSRDKKIRKKSSSGGLAYLISKYILKNNGVVYGVSFDQSFKAQHERITRIEDLYKIQGSKYVQSYVGNSLENVKQDLEENKTVLFTGTACQIAGLKSYLKKEYSNLYTIDVLCHGIPSPRIFEEYLISKNKESITSINFRLKQPSWTKYSIKIDYNKDTYIKSNFKDKYLRAFLKDYITNECCSSCKYTGKERVSDITLADFWGYVSEKYKYRNTEKGISLVLINNSKGKDLFNKINSEIIFIEKDFEEAALGNQCLRKPFEKNKKYNEFWEDYFKNDFDFVANKYFTPDRLTLKRKVSLFFNNYAFIIPKKIRRKMIEMRRDLKR